MAGLFILVALIADFFLSGFVVWLAYDVILASIFSLPFISYWACCAIGVALSLIGGFFRGSSGTRSSW